MIFMTPLLKTNLKTKAKNFAIMHIYIYIYIYISHLSLYGTKTYQSLILNQNSLIKKQKNKKGGEITWVEKV
jgi:hypothetical protein